MDDKKHPILFKLKYLFPQILSFPAILFIILSPILIPLMACSLISPLFLLSLLFLIFLLPIPSPGRRNAEIRGYGMSCKTFLWQEKELPKQYFDLYVDNFTGSAYFFMWPFRKGVERRLSWYLKSDECLSDENPAFVEVYNIINK